MDICEVAFKCGTSVDRTAAFVTFAVVAGLLFGTQRTHADRVPGSSASPHSLWISGTAERGHPSPIHEFRPSACPRE